MAEASPEKLVRGMYGDVDRPVIESQNDIDAPFGEVVSISPDLLAIIHAAPSVDPEPEVIEQVESESRVDVDKVTEENPQSRFRVVDSPVLAPGTCILCKSSGGDGRQFVDLAIQITWVGALYFCTFCVTEAAKLLGLTSREVFQGAIDGLQDELSKSDDLYVETKVKLDATMVLLRDYLNGNYEFDSSSSEIPEAELVDVSTSDSDERDVDELAFVEGSDDVSGSTSDDIPVETPKPKRTRRTG